MKEKGFTLIELLAVIVILAIIALIATPVVLNIIKSSKGSSIERSAELYLDQVKTEIARYNMNHPGANFNPSICEVQGNGVKCDDSDEILPVEITGDKPEDGSKIILSNGQVIGTKDFKIDSKNLTYEDGRIKEGIDKPTCTRVTSSENGNVPQGNYTLGDEYICEVNNTQKFNFYIVYVKDDKIDLMLNKNICEDGTLEIEKDSCNVEWITETDYVGAGGSNWNARTSYNKGPITALRYLNKATSTWTNIISKPELYDTYDNYNISTVLKAKLPDGNILTSDCNPMNNYSNCSSYYLSSSNYWTTSQIYGGILYGVDKSFVSSSYLTDRFGIRPVITVSKSDLN